MARARNIKPSLFLNEDLGTADPLLTILFEGLWCLADRKGRLSDRPLRIKASVFPYRDGLNLGQMLDWLAEHGFIRRYVVDGSRYIQVLNFEKHQRPHTSEVDSEIPEYKEVIHGGAKKSPDGAENTPQDALNTDSLLLIPDSPFLIGEGAAEKPEEDILAYRPSSSLERKDGRAVATYAVNGHAQAELEEWLDAVAPKLGARSRSNIADFRAWEDVCIKAISDGMPLSHFLDTLDAERNRNRDNPHFLTPKAVLKVAQANQSKPEVSKFIH